LPQCRWGAGIAFSAADTAPAPRERVIVPLDPARSCTLTAADAGARIALHVQGTKTVYTTIIRTSGPTVPIAL
jgi:hypothetical protein